MLGTDSTAVGGQGINWEWLMPVHAANANQIQLVGIDAQCAITGRFCTPAGMRREGDIAIFEHSVRLLSLEGVLLLWEFSVTPYALAG